MTDSSIWALSITFVIMVLFSAFFSATETAFSVMNKLKIKNLAQKGKRRAELALKLYNKYDKLISTILIGNNIVNITAATIATVLFSYSLGENIGATVSTVVTTIIVLIFGEITPKSLAKENPEAIALFSSPLIYVMYIILWPLNYLFTGIKIIVSKLFKSKKYDSAAEEEIITLVEEAEEDGSLEKHEGELIKSAVSFNDLEVIEIITPRVDIIGINVNDKVQNLKKIFNESGYSRIPVFKNSIDNIIGMVSLKDFYKRADEQNLTISKLMQNVVYTTSTTKIYDLLKELQKGKNQMAIVVDEYGGTRGLVTIEDILEELVGEIWDETDEVIEEVKQIGEDKYIVNCSMSIEDFYEKFNMNPDDIDENDYDSTTLSGWVIEELGKLPIEGDSFTYANLNIKVTKINRRRVLEIEVTKLIEKEAEQNGDEDLASKLSNFLGINKDKEKDKDKEEKASE